MQKDAQDEPTVVLLLVDAVHHYAAAHAARVRLDALAVQLVEHLHLRHHLEVVRHVRVQHGGDDGRARLAVKVVVEQREHVRLILGVRRVRVGGLVLQHAVAHLPGADQVVQSGDVRVLQHGRVVVHGGERIARVHQERVAHAGMVQVVRQRRDHQRKLLRLRDVRAGLG